MCAYALLVAVAFVIFIPSHNALAEDAPLPTGIFLDNSAFDEDWSIGLINGGHYVNIFGGYESLGNPPVFSVANAWVAPGVVVYARVMLAGATTCNQLAHSGTGLTFYSPTMVAYGAVFVEQPANTSYCDFVFGGDGVPTGTLLSAAYLGSNGALLAGSTHNLGTSLNGSNEDAIAGGFSFQLCGIDGCSGGFASTTIPVEEPVATTTEPVATTTEPVATTTPIVPADTTPVEEESSHRPHSSSSRLPVFSTPEVVAPPAPIIAPVVEPAQVAPVVPVAKPAVRAIVAPEPEAIITEPAVAPAIATPAIEQPPIPLTASTVTPPTEPSALTASAYSALPGFNFSFLDFFRSINTTMAMAALFIVTIAFLGFAFIRSLFHLARPPHQFETE